MLVCVTPRANAKAMIESGRRNASRFHGELIVAYVKQHRLSPEDEAALEGNLAMARENGAEIQILEGEDAVGAILRLRATVELHRFSSATPCSIIGGNA